MRPALTDRLSRLEAGTAPPSPGRHLVFTVVAPATMSSADILTFLRGRGHEIYDEDAVLIGRLGVGPLRDLTPGIVTVERRAGASPASIWPADAPSCFTFQLDHPGLDRPGVHA